MINKHRKYALNDYFLENKEEYNENHAYFLGWAFSDGYVHSSEKTGAKYYKLSIAEKDKEILYHIKEIINFQGNVKIQYRKPSSILGQKEKKHQDRAYLLLSSKQLIPKMIELGLDKKKSTST